MIKEYCYSVSHPQACVFQEKVLPSQITKRVAIEAGTRDYWYKYVGLNGCVIGMSSFGASAPASDLFEHFKLNGAHVSQTVQAYLAEK